MTAKTPIFQLEYLVPGEPMRNTRAALENNAKSIEAALARGPASPPGSQDLLAVSGRVSTLENWRVSAEAQLNTLTTGAWATTPWVGGATGLNHDVTVGAPQCQYRLEGKRGFMRGWAIAGTSGVAANASVSTALPSAVRPTVAAELWATVSTRRYRLILQTTGVLLAVDAIPANTYINTADCHWALG